MLGIGFGEFALIFIVLIVVLGPERLPAFMKSVGTALRTLRQASRDIRTAVGFDELMRDPMSYQPPPRPRPPATDSSSDSGTETTETKMEGAEPSTLAGPGPRVEPAAGLTPTAGGAAGSQLGEELAALHPHRIQPAATTGDGEPAVSTTSEPVVVTQPLTPRGAPTPVAATVAVGQGEGPTAQPSTSPPPAAPKPAPKAFTHTQLGPGPGTPAAQAPVESVSSEARAASADAGEPASTQGDGQAAEPGAVDRPSTVAGAESADIPPSKPGEKES